jgi:hypothetical protein
MAKNPPKGAGRTGSVKERDQVFSRRNRRWTKRNMASGRFVDQKADWNPFKGVRKKK